MNRKLELIIGSVILVLIIGFIGTKAFGSFNTEEKGLKKLEHAIDTGDLKYLKNHIEIIGLNRELSNDEVKNIADALKEISIYDLEKIENNVDANISIIKKGKEKLIFDKYLIGLKMYDLTINSGDLKGKKLFIDDEEVGDFNGKEELVYEELLPGKYTLKLEYKGEYVNLSKKEELVALQYGSDNEIYLDIDLDEMYIDVESNLEEATLFIDGKDTGINLYSGYSLGPINEDTDIILKAVAKIDGKTYESHEEKTIGSYDGENFDLYIDYDDSSRDRESTDKNPENHDEIMEEIEYLMDGYQLDFVRAVNNGAYSYIEPYIEYGSPFMNTQQSFIKDMSSKNTQEDLIDYIIQDVEAVDKNKVYATVREFHTIYYANGKEKDVENTWKYTIVIKDGKFLIRDLAKAN